MPGAPAELQANPKSRSGILPFLADIVQCFKHRFGYARQHLPPVLTIQLCPVMGNRPINGGFRVRSAEPPVLSLKAIHIQNPTPRIAARTAQDFPEEVSRGILQG